MKKLLLSMAAVFLMSCYTPTVDQTELYGRAEEVLFFNGHYRVKVWAENGKYYNVITNKFYQVGDVIKIK